MGQPVVHFEIGGRDGEQLRGFYTELFDWNLTVAEDLNNYAGVCAEEEGIGGGIMTTTEDMPPALCLHLHPGGRRSSVFGQSEEPWR